MQTRMRSTLTAAALLTLSACTRPGINAGEEGGKAFVLMAIMLIATIVVLWLILGRED
ncbi:MAG: hypothetical protein M3273_07630 [Actinomycetota bacterium]|nr:hypothetical protein [Actinomycetota bacterium]